MGATSVQGGSTNNIGLFPVAGPQNNRHTMLSAAQNLTDYYGGFPVTCPNGSNYSIKLGNEEGGALAEGVSYEFTIPANRNTYSLTYFYAVVFEDPFHQVYQQPRLEIESLNVTDNEVINCSSFSFFPNGSPLPGFFKSSRQRDTTSVWCKDWSAVTLNLNGKAGKTIRLSFRTADCTFRRHFGYAYIDVNSECDSEFVGANYCTDDTSVQVTGPYGYSGYKWFNQNFSQVLGNGQSLTFTPPPPSGTTIALEVTPFFGYGCVDTFYAKMVDTLKIIPDAGRDTLYCFGGDPVRIGSTPKPGVNYIWTPATGLNNANIANPLAAPNTNTTYTLTVRSLGGGCLDTDSVRVSVFNSDTSVTLVGKDYFCAINNDSAILYVNQAGLIQWYKDGVAIAGAIQRRYQVFQSGTYNAIIRVENGCVVVTGNRKIVIEIPVAAVRYPTVSVVRNRSLALQARQIGITALWSPAVFLNNANTFTPVYTGNKYTTYNIKINTRGGCVTVDTLSIRVFEYQEIFVPSAFSPNNDGRNDFVFPIAAGFTKINYFRIYNRWGQLMFSWNDFSKGWDGFYRGQQAQLGTYVWQDEALDTDGTPVRKKGTIVLLR